MHKLLYLVLLILFTGCAAAPEYTPVSNPESECVLLIHGLARSNRSMLAMQEAFSAKGYHVINLDYPSTDYPIEELSQKFLAPVFERYCQPDKINKIHVVAHSMGGIILRYYLQHNVVPHLGRVVMLAPPNHGSELIDAFDPVVIWINGPAASQLSVEHNDFLKSLPPINFALGVIAGNESWNPLYSSVIPGEDDGKVSVASTKIDGMQDFLLVDYTHTFIMGEPDVIAQVIHFIENGYFANHDN